MKRYFKFTLIFAALFSIPQISVNKAHALSVEKIEAKFLNIKNGDVVTSPFKVDFTITHLTVAPAGTMTEGTGHHHIIIDGGPIPEGQIIPADEKHLHYGKGQTSAEIALPPGKHTLTLQFASGLHLSYGPGYSQTIEIEVK